MTRARVVGAGLSGLCAAWFLARRGVSVDVVESSADPGGLIQTIPLTHGPVEVGANAFVWTPAVARLFDELGLAPQFARDARRRRYIYRDGRPRRWPLTPVETAGMLGRFGGTWLRRAARAHESESVAAWGDRVLGRAATAWLLGPALQGIYGAPASELSARAIGNARRRRRGRVRLASPREGMGALISALHGQLLQQGVTFHFGETVTTLDASVPAIVCAGAATAASLVAPHHPEFGRAAARIRTAPLVTATAFFEPHDDDIRGFGVLFPRGTARALGVLFNTEIFDHRGTFRSERWIYGDPLLVDASARQIEDAILQDRRLLTHADRRPVAVHATGWHHALPIYDDAVLETARAAAALPSWLGVCGNYLGRIGVSALVERAEAEAARIAAGPAPG